MNCELCSQPYNLTNRYPLTLPCCDETICKECKQQIAGAPQQDTFKCPITNCGEQNSNQTKFRLNRAIEKFLKQQLGIFCDDHANGNAEFYCNDHCKLVCKKCIVSTHKNHNNIVINKELITNYNKSLLEKLNFEMERIKSLIMEMQSYQNNERQLTATQYLRLIIEAQEILLPRLKTEKEKNSIKLINNDLPLSLIEEQKLDIESVLVTESDEFSFIQESIGQLNLKFELLFRGSRDGFEASQFHQKCDNKGPTLTVIKSEHNRIFGGYTGVSWKSTDKEQWSEDGHAFIFSLTDKNKITQSQNKDYAIICHKDYGPIFGFGSDIHIKDQCNSNNNSRSNNGGTYNLPKGNDNSNEYAKSYLAGSHNFKVLDYEVFQVIIQ